MIMDASLEPLSFPDAHAVAEVRAPILKYTIKAANGRIDAHILEK
jgi:hypothetical protein